MQFKPGDLVYLCNSVFGYDINNQDVLLNTNELLLVLCKEHHKFKVNSYHCYCPRKQIRVKVSNYFKSMVLINDQLISMRRNNKR